MKKKVKIVKDSFGMMEVPADKYWGAQTQRSLINFKINDEKMTLALIHALVFIKKACAIANCKVKKLSKQKADYIIKVCDLILNHKLDDNFPLSIWQTGSGTQTNMNVNEVISFKANELAKKSLVHPNDDVNMSQSSNDVFPTGILLTIANLTRDKLIPSLDCLIASFKKLENQYKDVVKVGRTHLQDATPISLGQEISAWTSILVNAKKMINDTMKYVYQLPIGGTAVGTGINTPKGFDKSVCDELSKMLNFKFTPIDNKFRGLSSKDAVSLYHSSLKVLAEGLMKIANDIRWLAAGPNCSIGEIFIPQNEPGSSIMPGKVNPTQCESMMMLCIQVIANNLAITIGNTQGNFQLNTFMPMIIYNVNQSVNLLADGMKSLNDKCVVGIKPNHMRINKNLDSNLMLATSLNVKIGYDKASQIVKYAIKEGLSLRESAIKLGFLSSEEYDKIVQPKKMI